jgi:hypothetical protein
MDARRPSAAPPVALVASAHRSSFATAPPEPSRANLVVSPPKHRPSLADVPPEPSRSNVRQRGETVSTPSDPPRRPSEAPRQTLLDQLRADTESASRSNSVVGSASSAFIAAALAEDDGDDLNEEQINRHLTRTITQLRIVDMKKVDEGFSGYLKKRNHTIGIMWQRRWFSLQGYRLLYYKDEQAKFTLAAESPPEAYISLQYVTNIVVTPENEHNGKFTVQANELEWELEAADDADRAMWLNYLNNSIAYYKAAFQQHKLTLDHSPISQADLLSRKEGVLRKLGRFNKWSDRHFVLQDGILFYFKKKNGKRSGRLPLYGATLKEHDPSQFSFSVTNGRGDVYLLAATDEYEMHSWLNAIVKNKLIIEEQIDLISF